MSNEITEDRSVRNAIFAAREAVEKSKHQSPLPVQQELGIEVISSFAPLPTKGLVYPEDHPLHGKEDIEFKEMTAKEENILMSRALIRKGTVVNELMRSSVLDKNIDLLSLLSGDRMSLLFAIRAIGISDDFSVVVTCPRCENTQEETYQISNFKTKDLDPTELEQVQPYQNLFKFILPRSKKEVLFKFLTGRDEEEIVQIVEAKKKKGIQNEEAVTTKLLFNIVELDGKKDRSFIAKFIQNMPATDSRALRNFIDKHEPGIDTTQKFVCKNCDHEEDMTPPLGVTFLWPDA